MKERRRVVNTFIYVIQLTAKDIPMDMHNIKT